MPPLWEKAARVEKRLERIERWVMIILVALLTAVTFLQVFSRYAMRNPLFWTEELARFLFIYVCMIGIAMGIGTKGHYGFENLFRALPRAWKRSCGFLSYAVMGFFIIIFTWMGFEELPSTANQVSVSLPGTMIWSYAALPLGGLLMMVHHLLKYIIEGSSKWH
jgi:TRAP-type C4-dicarboxylate transport system permease small subunit